ncbi:MAG TPA: alpha/beta fold hydrolase [Thermoanaerobaculia bacterium]|nr:alpha/beta fold hydrolase [Thermoanaerobaculia bacterium]
MRLFCFPYAGGGATVYRPWVRAAPAGVQIRAVELPGRETRMFAEPFRSMDALIPALLGELRAQLEAPFALFGHSMGALIAFELTRALRRTRAPQPARLFLSAHRAPHLRNRRPAIHDLRGDAFWAALRRLGGTPEEVFAHRDLMELVEPTLRADFELCERYQFTGEDPLDVPLTLFGGTEDPNVSELELLAWQEHTRAGVRLKMFAGQHLFLQHSHAAVLREVLDDLSRENPHSSMSSLLSVVKK